MQNTVWLVPLLCAAALGQVTPDKNAAATNMQKRLESLKLNGPRPIVRVMQPSTTCAIPLLTFTPSGNYKMPVVKPPTVFADDNPRAGIVKPPMNACPEQLFRNK